MRLKPPRWRRLHKQLQTHHSKSDDKDLFVLKPDTNLSGAKLLDRTLDIKEKIAAFVEKTVVSKKTTYAWQDRKSLEFQQKYMEELVGSVDKSVMVIEQLDKLMSRIKKDCE